MASWIENVKVGDKVRYLGGDPNAIDNLTVGKEYEVKSYGYDDYYGDEIVFESDEGYPWGIGSAYENTTRFELVTDNASTSKTTEDKTRDMLVSLSQEVATLKRQLSSLKEEVDSYRNDTLTWGEESTKMAYEIDELNAKVDQNVELFIEDIAMLDERTQSLVSDDNSDIEDGKIVRKVVTYEYDGYYSE